MARVSCTVVFLILAVISVETAKILCFLPLPQRSHHVAFTSLIGELLSRNHEIVVVTVNPSYPKGQTPQNLTEIDIHDVSDNTWTKNFVKHYEKDTVVSQVEQVLNLFAVMFKKQFSSDNMQKLFNSEKVYDIMIADGPFSPYCMVLSHILKVPLIGIATIGVSAAVYDNVGVPRHTLYYPQRFQTICVANSYLEMYKAIYDNIKLINLAEVFEQKTHEVLKTEFFPDIPGLNEIKNNIQALFLNVYIIWDGIKPYPPNCSTFKFSSPKQTIPKDILSYLDSSKDGVIYASFGTRVIFSLLPEHTISVIFRVFSQLPYQILLRCDKDELPGRPENVKLFKWLPQAEILKHPKINLFITQGGQHSIDEAIEAGVPMIVIPNMFDQFANSERCVHHGIGKNLDLKTMSEENLMDAIKNIVEDKRYQENIVKLRAILQDTPMKSMDRLIWAIEYTIRHGGAQHMRSPSANLSWAEYFELELLCTLLSIIILFVLLIIKLLWIVKRWVVSVIRRRERLNEKFE